MGVIPATEQQVRTLRTADAVRTRAAQMLEIGLRNGLAHFAIDLDAGDAFVCHPD